MQNWEFKDRSSLERYTREYISTYFETQVKNGDVVPKNYTFGKIAGLTDTELYDVLKYYRGKNSEIPLSKTRITTIKDYSNSDRLSVNHKIDFGDAGFWIFMIFVLIVIIMYLRSRK